MDIQMPEMDGYQVTRAVHRLAGREHVPVVAMTAHVGPEDRRRCHECGMHRLPSQTDRARRSPPHAQALDSGRGRRGEGQPREAARDSGRVARASHHPRPEPTPVTAGSRRRHGGPNETAPVSHGRDRPFSIDSLRAPFIGYLVILQEVAGQAARPWEEGFPRFSTAERRHSRADRGRAAAPGPGPFGETLQEEARDVLRIDPRDCAPHGESRGLQSEVMVLGLHDANALDGAAADVDRASGGLVARALETNDFKGEPNETLLLYPMQGPARRILLVGLGKAQDLNCERIRSCAATAARRSPRCRREACRGLSVRQGNARLARGRGAIVRRGRASRHVPVRRIPDEGSGEDQGPRPFRCPSSG